MQSTTLRPRTWLLAPVLLAAACLAPLAAWASNYSDAVTAAAPIAWYRLGADANDSAGGHHGTVNLMGGVTFGQPGAIQNDTDGSALFDSSVPGYIELYDSPDFNFGTLDDFSIEFWAKRAAGTTKYTVINKGDTNGAFWMRYEIDGRMTLNLDYGTTANTVTSPLAYADDQWHHFVGAADRNEKITLYVDGLPVAQQALLGRGSVSTPGKDAYVGYLPARTTPPKTAVNYWTGSLDEMAVYNTTLTGTQISAHYYSGIGGFGSNPYDVTVAADAPIAWWRMADVTDSGSGAHASTAGTSVTFGQPTAIANDTTGAAYFNGTDSPPITVADAADLNFGVDTDFTLEAWVKVDDFSASPNDRAFLFNKGDTETSYWMRVQSDGTVRFIMDYGATALDVASSPTDGDPLVLDGQWHHLVGVADRDVGMELYIDSILVDTQGLFNDNDVSSTLNVQIGMLGAGSAMNGHIDELAIYDRLLTDAEVLNHYTLGAPPQVSIPGDADRNGVVDAADAQLLAQNWGSSGETIGWAQGDFNDDHTVNAADASILAANWRAGSGEAASSVPEPTSLVGLAGAAVVLATLLRRLRR